MKVAILAAGTGAPLAQDRSFRPKRMVTQVLEEEHRVGLSRYTYHDAFDARVRDLRTAARALIGRLDENGKSIADYGARQRAGEC